MDSADPDTLRLFYALWPDDKTRDALTALQAPLRGRVTHRDNLHLTLAFLGSQPAKLLPALQDILHRLPDAATMLQLDRLGYFGQRRIAWAGAQQTPAALTTLQAALAGLLDQGNIEYERRPTFRAHVTLARHAAAPPDTPIAPILWRADQVALVQSQSEDGVVRYRVLGVRRLK